MKPQFLLLFVFSLALSGCGRCFELKTPKGFVELREDGERYAYRATSADGLVLAVRELSHEPKGTLEFWSQAIENQMRNRGGYALLTAKDVTARGGLPGRALRFGHDEGSTPHLYAVNIYVTEARIYLVEYGGKKELVQKSETELDAILADFVGR